MIADLALFGDSDRKKSGIILFAFAWMHFGAVYLGNEFYLGPQHVATLWPGSGLFMGALLISRFRAWPGLVLAATMSQMTADIVIYDKTLLNATLFGINNIPEALVGAFLLRRLFRGIPDLNNVPSVLRFVTIGALGSTLFSAVSGAYLVTKYNPGVDYWNVFQVWWFADALGVLVVAPVVLGFGNRLTWPLNPLRPRRLMELVAFFGALLLTIHYVFGTNDTQPRFILDHPYILFPFMLWATMRFGFNVLSAALFVSSLLVVLYADLGYGRFIEPDQSVHQFVLSGQAFLTVLLFSSLMLFAIITERRGVEARLSKAFHANPNPVMITSVETSKIIEINGAAETLFGFTREEALGKSTRELGLWQDPDARSLLIDKLKKESVVRRAEISFRTKSGNTGICTLSAESTTIGNAPCIISFIRDLSAQKQAEEALIRSEGLFRSIVNDQADLIVRWMPDGTRTFVNESYCRYFGLKREEAIGTSFFDLILPEDHQNVLNRIYKLTPENPSRSAEHFVKLPDGSMGWNWWSDRGFFDENGALIELQSVGRDITEVKQAQESLRESQARYQRLSGAAFEGVGITEKGRITDANEAMARMLRCELDELIGSPIDRFVAPESRDTVAKAISSLSTDPYEHVAMRSDGTKFPIEAHGRMEMHAGRKIRITVIRDLTERKKFEAEAERTRQQLIHADKMVTLGTLVSGVAHEVNNPNQSIMLNTPMLQLAWEDMTPVLDEHLKRDPSYRIANLPYQEMREEIPRLIHEILQSSDRIKSIVSGLRDFALKQSPQVRSLIDINEILKSATVLVANPIKKSTNHFSVEYGDGLPPVQGNPVRLEQVVVNLIINACQALSSRQGAITVSTHYDKNTKRVSVTVKDEGVGIPEKDLAHIKDPFFTTKRDAGGTGLGLAVSARIAEEHQADLEIESEVGVGTTVRLSLPVPVREEA